MGDILEGIYDFGKKALGSAVKSVPIVGDIIANELGLDSSASNFEESARFALNQDPELQFKIQQLITDEKLSFFS